VYLLKETNMLDQKDSESLTKAVQGTNLLVQDLKQLVAANNPILGEIARGLLKEAVTIEHTLQRVITVTKS
jgi:hypothetical protein